MKIIAFDPSIRATGVACLLGRDVFDGWTIKPKSQGADRYAEIARQVECDLRGLAGPDDAGLPVYAVIETPDRWTRKPQNETTKKEQSLNVEALQKLCTVVGVIVGVCTVSGLHVRLYRPSAWKKKKTKKQTQSELRMQGYDPEELRWDDHTCDAAALALWAQGQIRIEPERKGRPIGEQ